MEKMQIKNRTIFNKDNLDILRGINSSSIDLIYLDPPFNKKKVFTAPIGSSAEGAEFSDIFRQEDVKDEWLQEIKEDYRELNIFLTSVKDFGGSYYLYNYCYLCYMAIRLIEIQRILKDTGSIYFHCDPTMSHYLKILMDIIFGEKNFRNEIVWKRTNRGFKGSQFEAKKYNSNTDIIYFYSKTNDFFFNMGRVLVPYNVNYLNSFNFEDDKGKYYLDTVYNRLSASPRPNLCYKYKNFYPPHKSGWKIKKSKMEELDKNGEIIVHKNQLYRKIRPKLGSIRNCLWDDILESKGRERTGYPTQKPLALLERIIKASSNEGDIVLDPFCGCATTCIAAERLDRKWIGIDVSVKAFELVKQRLKKEVKSDLFETKEVPYTTIPPERTDQPKDFINKKYVYIISYKKYKLFKVGIAKDWKSRLNSYQTSDPDRAYKMEYKLLTHKYRALENHIHKHFESIYEWVDAPLKDIIDEMNRFENE